MDFKFMRFYLIIIFAPFFLFSQIQYEKNDHVKIKTKIKQDNYVIYYSFKDHFGDINDMILIFDKNKMDEAISKFGIPYSMFDSYEYSSLEQKKRIQKERHRILKEGLFHEKDRELVLDYNAIVAFYR